MTFLSRKINKYLSEKNNFSSEKMFLTGICTLCALIFLPIEKSFAWGGRGHHTICEAATFLVKEKGLKKFLQHRTNTMGHLCNIPDTQWRNESGDAKSAGDSTHFIDPELLGFTPKTMPLDIEKLKKEFTGKPNQVDKTEIIYSVPRQVGSVYWRVDQLMNILANQKTEFAEAKLPQNKSEEQNYDLPYNKAVYKFMTTAGVLGHFIGDTAQPFHNTSDYDGYESGHGGIHGYYEEVLVSEIDGYLLSKILNKASSLKHPEWQKGNYLERMRTFSALAYEDIEKIKKMDPIIKKSEFKNEKGMKLKTAAKRKEPSEAIKKFEPLIVTHMARASLMLAQFWDDAYRSAGSPDLSAYRSYKFPFNVDFIYPTYDDTGKKP